MTAPVLAAVALVSAAALVFALCRCTWWWPRWPADVPCFVMLHSVADDVVDPACPNNTLRPRELEGLIMMLKRHGYTLRKFSDAVADPGLRTAVLTFDDGYADNYTNLFPILKRHGVPATCFVTNRGDGDTRFLSREQMREMAASGLVEFGGHTATHALLDGLGQDEVKREIESNREWIAAVLGKAPKAFAYPCGRENPAVVEAVRRAGYACAAAMVKKMRPPALDPWRIHRQIVPRGTSPFRAYLLATRGKWKI